MRLVLVTDAWFPQVNGVVRTLSTLCRKMEEAGDQVLTVTPENFRSIPCPTYPEIRLAMTRPAVVGRRIDDFGPEAVHIATEGPLGLAARRHCLRRGYPFTTGFHTRFPEYIHARFRVPIAMTTRLMQWFHAPSRNIMVPTESMAAELERQGFRNVRRWNRGVDTDLFKPGPAVAVDGPRPVMISVGRVAVEKNIGAFLDLDVPGTKLVVGDGPMLARLRGRYPEVRFVGAKHGADLVAHYNAADVFVFPSLTDTFGLVQLEALACGLPVAAFPVTGPRDVITDPRAGCLHEDLKVAVETALTLDAADCRAFAEGFSWNACVERFKALLDPFDSAEPDRLAG